MELKSVSTRKKPVSLALTPTLLAEVDDAAVRLDRSRSWITAAALAAWLAARRVKPEASE